MIVSGLVMAGLIYFSDDPKFKCFVLQREDKVLFPLQAYEHGQYDTSPFDPFEKRKCEVYGVGEGTRFIVRRIRAVDNHSDVWEGPTTKKCPECLITIYAGSNMCPYCTAKC